MNLEQALRNPEFMSGAFICALISFVFCLLCLAVWSAVKLAEYIHHKWPQWMGREYVNIWKE